MTKVKCIFIVILLFFFTGCAAVALFGVGAATGVAGYKYYKGALTVVYEAPLLKTFNASMTALDRKNIIVERSDHDLTSGNIVAKRTDNTPVTISLKYKSARETEVVIRVGHLGDKESSMAIKEEISKVLFGE